MLVFLVLAIGSFAFILLIMKIPALYDVLGKRMEDLFKELFGVAANDGSLNARANMFSLGWEWFKQKPILGYGLNNFSLLYLEEMGWATYSHNNFVEILVSGGLVGFAIYYSAYIYLFVKLIKVAFLKRDLIAITLLVFNLSLIIMNVSNISYYSTADNCMLMLALVYVYIKDRNSENN